MSIDADLVKKMLEESREELLREVDNERLLADQLDKMFNFGVLQMFHTVLGKVYQAEIIARKVSA